MIYEDIKKANIEAMKAKDTIARSIYGVVMNKLMLESIKKREKNEVLSDADVVNILQKSIKELAEEADNYSKVNNQEQEVIIRKQIQIIEQFLPAMMSDAEIKDIIMSLPDKSVPFVMKHFKANYNGKCDMRLVQSVLKEIQ